METNAAGFTIDGDRATWHIRLIRRVAGIEAWQLWQGETPQSSLFPRADVAKWRDEELAKLANTQIQRFRQTTDEEN